MAEIQQKSLPEIKLTEPEEQIKTRKVREALIRIISAPFPFLWIERYRVYMKWASLFLQAKARARLRFFLALSASITLMLLWLYFGGPLLVLLKLFFWLAVLNAGFKALLFTWIFFHLKSERPVALSSAAIPALLRELDWRLKTAKNALPAFRHITAVAAAIIFVAVVFELHVLSYSPFPVITLYGKTSNAGAQSLFLLIVMVIFDIAMTVFCINGFKVEDRSPLIKSDKTIGFRDFRDPTPEGFFMAANSTGYIPETPLSFDFARFEQNFMVFGAPNMARENIVNWLLMCAFADPNTIAVCLDGGRNDDIAFRHLRNLPGVFIGEINDNLSNTYTTIINWVCWLADLADDAFMRRHNAAMIWRPELTRIVVFCDPEVTDIVMKTNLRKVGKNKVTGKIKVIWQHPLYDIVEPMEKLFSYGKSHGITFVCVAKHMYHQLSVPKDKRDAFFNIVSHYNVFDTQPDGTEGWIKVKTPPFKYTVGINWRDEFLVGTAPLVTNADLAEYIFRQWEKANDATVKLWNDAAGEVPSRPIKTNRPKYYDPIIRPGTDFHPQPRSFNPAGQNFDGNGRDGGKSRKREKKEKAEQEEIGSET